MNEESARENEDASEDDKTSTSGEAESRQSDEAAASETHAGEDVIQPYGQKIGEARGNLRQREQWFQQRSGTRK